MDFGGKSGTFQLILGAVFFAFAIVAFIVFAKSGKTANQDNQGVYSGTLTVWSIIPETFFTKQIEAFKGQNPKLNLVFKQIPEDQINAELIQNLAQGSGPDVVMFPTSRLFQFRGILYPLGYDKINKDNFTRTFIEATHIVAQPEGVYGFPVLIDPMVLYVNKDILASVFKTSAPLYWDEMVASAPAITQKNDAGAISRSTIALGFPLNIHHSDDIATLFFLQLGNAMVTTTDQGLASGGIQYATAFRQAGKFSSRPITDAVEYMTSFSNATAPQYSWSAGLPGARDMFIQDRLFAYIGYASEYNLIRQANPNLNFSIEVMPQMRGATTKTTFAKVYAFGVTRRSQNAGAAFAFTKELVQPSVLDAVYKEMQLPPVFTSLLAQQQNDSRTVTLYRSALIAKTWLNPLPEAYGSAVVGQLAQVLSGAVSANQVAGNLDAALAPLFDAANEQNAKDAAKKYAEEQGKKASQL